MNLLTATCAIVKQLPAEADDRHLAVRLARGESEAFEQLVEQYGPRVTGLATRLLGWTDGADDVAQDVFLQVLRKGKQFRGQSSLWTWLATLTVNRCRSLQRRQWIHQRVMQTIAFWQPAETTTLADRPECDETAARIRAIVATLPAPSREVIVLRYFEELSIQQMADVLGTKRNTVEVRLTRARKQLEPLLAGLSE